jgi:hypothetical protein
MSLNPFETVHNYSEMLNKIAVYTFAVSLAMVIFMRSQSPEVDRALSSMTFAIPVGGLSLPLGTIVPAFVMAFISRVFKLHDRISDVLGIRRRFDRTEILLPMAVASGANLTVDQIDKFGAERGALMGKVFYKYASSDERKTQIDVHYVTMALDQWSWYWVILEALFVVGMGGLILTVVGRRGLGVIAAFVVLGGIGLLQVIRSTCAKYACDEMREILKVKGAQSAIRNAFNAL